MEKNPYQPPPDNVGDADVGKSPNSRWRIVAAIFVIAAVATALSFALPFVAVPAALLLVPATLRVLRVQAVRNANQLDSALKDRFMLIVISVLAAIPIGAASLVLFCCVCTPVGFVAASIKSQSLGPTVIGLTIALFLGLLAGLFFGIFLLRRLRFLSADVRNMNSKV